MSFAAPNILWLLLVIPPAMILFLWWSARERQRLMEQFIQARLLPGLIAGVSTRRQKMRAAGLVAAVFFLILALARPQWGFDWQEVTQHGLDIIVAIDTSKSMLAEDIAPNRLARAKLAALDLMQQAKSDRLGLVAFAGSAFLQCPLTIDDSAFRQSLEALDVNTIPQGGTAIAEAINEAAKAFKEGENHKVLVLFTDGEDHDSGAVEAAKKAKDAGVIIFTVGIGSAEGELLRIKNAEGQSDYVRDENGNVVKSHLNEALLRQIAGPENSGFYLPLRGADTMDMLYQKGIAPLPKSDAREKLVKRPMERYHWPLALAIGLLIAETLFPERKRRSKKAAASTQFTAASTAAVFILLAATFRTSASPSKALQEYKSGDYDLAQKDYERALQNKTNDLRLHFNAGAAAYKDQHLEEAAKYFDQSLMSPDLNLQQKAYYNLGNTFYHLGEKNPDLDKKKESWENAIKSYDNAIKLTTNNADAKFNEEFVKRMLEQLKQQQQQQQKQNPDKNQKQDKDQQQDQKQNQQQSKDDQKKDQQQKQQNQNQNQKTDSQQQQAQNQKADQQKQPQSKPDSAQEKKGEQKKAEQQRAKKSDEEQKPEDQQGQAVAAGEMTPQEAKQLLDAQKNDEMLMPVSRKENASDQQKIIKDW